MLNSSFSKIIFFAALWLLFAGCDYRRPASFAFYKAKVASGNGNFNGVWNSTLKVTKDTCGFGLPSSFPITITIKQNKKNAKITFLNLPAYKGVVDGKQLVANGKYNSSSLKTNGSVYVKLASPTSLKILKSTLNITSGNTRCAVTFKGSGTKV